MSESENFWEEMYDSDPYFTAYVQPQLALLIIKHRFPNETSSFIESAIKEEDDLLHPNLSNYNDKLNVMKVSELLKEAKKYSVPENDIDEIIAAGHKHIEDLKS